ncbi:type II toxin-antitoxin system death-on-curing family toxin [Streptomyces sp. NPDC007084]|uniref:type II toxin-antitoxin system death-on-curing family toxin n=1 Tax=Streptomyces sp. NPDC007084 TaxID=3154313 RepID=UPI003454CE92
MLAGATPVLVHNCGGGGFKNPVSPDEITELNRGFGGMVAERGTPENVMINASRYGSFWEKSAVVIRDIAGSHMFDNGNKRTAHAVVSRLMDRNGITSGPTSDELWSVISRVATPKKAGHSMDVGEIASMLRGY